MEASNIAFYKFVALDDPQNLSEKVSQKAAELELLGTVLLATEGINGMLAGQTLAIQDFEEWLCRLPFFSDLHIKRSVSGSIPFKRLKVRVKDEILTLGQEDVKPQFEKSNYIMPKDLCQALDAKEDITLIDIRNDFEFEWGHFVGAQNPKTRSFKDFAQFAQNLNIDRKKKIVTYCTGGIRCEKGSLLLKKAGFENVYQLKGGILEYFNQISDGRYFEGRCFVFDERESLTP